MPPLSELEREQRLDEVLAAYLRSCKEGAAPGRRELLDRHPELADDLAAFFADQDRLDQIATPLRAMTPAVNRLAEIRNFGDYEILEEIARGGMGVVFKAWQKSLGRVVALKMLLAGPWASAVEQQRFRAEAESVAHLDHPNILPIYEVGTYDGHPYLSMKLVEGGSLAHRLSDAGHRPSSKEAARLLATVADAVHYAHQRGILHRDLKPANILLQREQGRERGPENPRWETGTGSDTDRSVNVPGFSTLTPIVADFGLAKRAPRPTWPGISPSRALSSAVPTVPQPPALTHTGAIVGTPGYMAPEQASGSGDAVTTAADVYGLGSILYEMLTGRPPFKGPSSLDTMRQVLEQEPIRPGSLNPAVDRDMETICLKCLQKEPARRYASARELADDLRRYLKGEPILARPVGSLARMWRWVRRQPVIAGLTLALVVVFLGGLGSVTALWLRAEDNAHRADEQRLLAEEHGRAAERQRDKARTAWEQAEKNRRDAERHLEDSRRSFQMAHQAVHDFCRRVSDELHDAPHLQPLRKKLLQTALNYYQSFLEQRGQDPTLRRELADTQTKMARLIMSIGSRADARAAFEQAVTLYRDLQRANPDNLELQCKLADALNGIAILEDTTDGTLARLHEARAAHVRFLEKHPGDPVLRSGLAVTLSNIGLASQRMGRLSQAGDWFREARAIQEKLLKEKPNHEGVQANLANALINYSALRNQEPGGRDDALQALERVLELRTALANPHPRDAGRQADLAAVHQDIGITLRDAGRQADSLESFQKAYAIREKLARDNPFVMRYKADLAASYIDLGFSHSIQKRKEKALELYQKARDIQKELFRLDPGAPGIRRELGLSWFRIGTVQGALGRRPEEYQAFLQARELQEALVKSDPDTLDYRRDLARTLNNLGWNRMALNHPEETPPLMRGAIEHMRVALSRAPQVKAYRETLTSNYGTLSEAEMRLGHLRAAAEALREHEKLWPDNPEELYRVAHHLAIVAGRVGRGKAELTPDEQSERRQYLDRVLAVLRQATAHGFRDAARLRNDKALDPLHLHDGFRELMRDLEKQAPASK